MASRTQDATPLRASQLRRMADFALKEMQGQQIVPRSAREISARTGVDGRPADYAHVVQMLNRLSKAGIFERTQGKKEFMFKPDPKHADLLVALMIETARSDGTKVRDLCRGRVARDQELQTARQVHNAMKYDRHYSLGGPLFLALPSMNAEFLEAHLATRMDGQPAPSRPEDEPLYIRAGEGRNDRSRDSLAHLATEFGLPMAVEPRPEPFTAGNLIVPDSRKGKYRVARFSDLLLQHVPNDEYVLQRLRQQQLRIIALQMGHVCGLGLSPDIVGSAEMMTALREGRLRPDKVLVGYQDLKHPRILEALQKFGIHASIDQVEVVPSDPAFAYEVRKQEAGSVYVGGSSPMTNAALETDGVHILGAFSQVGYVASFDFPHDELLVDALDHGRHVDRRLDAIMARMDPRRPLSSGGRQDKINVPRFLEKQHLMFTQLGMSPWQVRVLQWM